MAERLRIQGGSPPFRVFAPGANPSSPGLSGLLFDGDSSTLRLWMRGAINVGNFFGGAGATVNWYNVAAVAVALGKTFPFAPLALAAEWRPFVSTLSGIPARLSMQFGVFSLPTSQNGSIRHGIGIWTTTTHAYPFSWYDSAFRPGGNTVYYCVFDNPAR